MRLLDRATTNENHDRFVKRIIKYQKVWYLKSEDGIANSVSNDDEETTVLMFWSDSAYAKRVKENGFENYDEQSMDLFEFLYRWLPGMTSDGVLAGTNWTHDLIGNEYDAFDLREEIEIKMPISLKEQYEKNYNILIIKE